MNFLKGFSQIKKITGVFMPTVNKPVPVQTKGILYFRYAARLGILFLALFILLWWPAQSFQTESFNDWSAKMAALPNEVWYLLLSIILSWGVSEISAARAINNIPTGKPSNPYDSEDDFMSAGDNLDGRFANLNNEDDFLSGPAEPNTVIEDWHNNETQ